LYFRQLGTQWHPLSSVPLFIGLAARSSVHSPKLLQSTLDRCGRRNHIAIAEQNNRVGLIGNRGDGTFRCTIWVSGAGIDPGATSVPKAVVLVPEATGWASQDGSRRRFLLLLNEDRLLLRLWLRACGQRASVVQARRHVHSRFPAAAPDCHRRPVGQRLVRAAIVVEGDPGADPGPRRAAVGIGFQVDLLVFQASPQPPTKTLSSQRPRSSMLIAMPASSRVVNAALVNCAP
jgi:hypothetical protein